jgi:hypothetical protein
MLWPDQHASRADGGSRDQWQFDHAVDAASFAAARWHDDPLFGRCRIDRAHRKPTHHYVAQRTPDFAAEPAGTWAATRRKWQYDDEAGEW